jgi:hypothetical protein
MKSGGPLVRTPPTSEPRALAARGSDAWAVLRESSMMVEQNVSPGELPEPLTPRQRKLLPGIFGVLFVFLQAVHLLPPIVVDGDRATLPSVVVAMTSAMVAIALATGDRVFRARERFGLFTSTTARC